MDIGQGLSMTLGIPIIADWTSPDRPKSPKKGTFGFNSDTNSFEFWNGSTWLTSKLTKLS